MSLDFGKAIIDKIEKTESGCVLNVPNRGTFGIKVHLTKTDMLKIAEMLKEEKENKK